MAEHYSLLLSAVSSPRSRSPLYNGSRSVCRAHSICRTWMAGLRQSALLAGRPFVVGSHLRERKNHNLLSVAARHIDHYFVGLLAERASYLRHSLQNIRLLGRLPGVGPLESRSYLGPIAIYINIHPTNACTLKLLLWSRTNWWLPIRPGTILTQP